MTRVFWQSGHYFLTSNSICFRSLQLCFNDPGSLISVFWNRVFGCCFFCIILCTLYTVLLSRNSCRTWKLTEGNYPQGTQQLFLHPALFWVSDCIIEYLIFFLNIYAFQNNHSSVLVIIFIILMAFTDCLM